MKKNFKRLTALVCTAILSIGIAGCGGGQSAAESSSTKNGSRVETSSESVKATSAESVAAGSAASEVEPNTVKSDETLTVALMGEPRSLYCSIGSGDTNAWSVMRLLYNRLVEVDTSTGEIVPSLAESWEWIDNTHLKINIRKGVKAADGSEFTANDVMYTYITAAKNNSPIPNYIDIENTTVDDDYSLTLTLVNEDAGFLYQLADNTFGVISESATEALGGAEATITNPSNGTGKYSFKEWKSGEYIILERNEDYWDDDYAGYYKTVKYVFIPDGSARMLAAQSGDVDIAVGLGVGMAQSVQGDNVRFEPTCAGCVSNLTVNCAIEPFNNQKVREAMRLLVDGETLNQAINMGVSTLQSPWLSTRNPYYVDVLPEGGYDPLPREEAVAEAKKLLEEAGFPNGFEFTQQIMNVQEGYYTILQSMLAEGGITLNLEMVDQSVFSGNMMEGKWQICDGAVLGLMQGDMLVTVLDPEQHVFGSINYNENGFGDLVKEALTAYDEVTAKEVYAKLQQQIWDDCLVLCSYEQYYAAVMKSDLTGLKNAVRSLVYDVSEVRPISA